MSITILHFLQIFLKVKKFPINSTLINSAKKPPQKPAIRKPQRRGRVASHQFRWKLAKLAELAL